MVLSRDVHEIRIIASQSSFMATKVMIDVSLRATFRQQIYLCTVEGYMGIGSFLRKMGKLPKITFYVLEGSP